jgi:hypothetical protein
VIAQGLGAWVLGEVSRGTIAGDRRGLRGPIALEAGQDVRLRFITATGGER